MVVTAAQIEHGQKTDLKHLFPVFNGAGDLTDLCYLDSAATSLKPKTVIDELEKCYRTYNAPVHRGLYDLADQASAYYEEARQQVANYIGASSVIFTSSATHSINMVASSWAQPRFTQGDVIYVTRMEHHANYLPWLRVCALTGAEIRHIEIADDGALDIKNTPDLFDASTKLIALCHVSNVTGVKNDIEDICHQASLAGIPTLIDAAQSIAHEKIDVGQLKCDFLAFSGHKMFGPNGIGVLYCAPARLDEMAPLFVGGGMVDVVGDNYASTVFSPAPHGFEAGSPNLAGATGLATATKFVSEHRDNQIKKITHHAYEVLSSLDCVRVLPCPFEKRTSIISFTVEGVHPHDVAQTASDNNVAVRAGHHCAQPLMRHHDLLSTVRASFSLYNCVEDIHRLAEAISQAHQEFG